MAGDADLEVMGDGGPGAAVLEGLRPDTAYQLEAEHPGVPLPRPRGRGAGRRFRTLRPPPGKELARLATVSDCHLGGLDFGRLPRRHDGDGRAGRAEPLHERCLRAALAEAVAWGAELMVAKGDLTQGARGEEWTATAALLGAAGVPVEVIPGNHDARSDLEGARRALAARSVRLTVGGASSRDVAGLRVVMADVTVAGSHSGLVGPVAEEICALAAGAGGPVLIAIHQQFQRWERTTHWPPGIPASDGRAFLDRLAVANPAALVTSGHTHRHRARHHGPLRLSEVGSTKDFPGTWAGYAVHEGGIRQVVRRVADPLAMRWTDSTRHSYLGVWGAWAAWTRGARCFSYCWPSR